MRYEFGSPGWVGFMHGMICERMAALGDQAKGLDWSICEVFTDPPAHLSPSGAPLVWHCVVKDGGVEFGTTERTDVDFHVTIDYAAVLPLGRYDSRGDPARSAELAAMAQDLTARGLMKVVGTRAQRDPRLGNNHDAIARVTA